LFTDREKLEFMDFSVKLLIRAAQVIPVDAQVALAAVAVLNHSKKKAEIANGNCLELIPVVHFVDQLAASPAQLELWEQKIQADFWRRNGLFMDVDDATGDWSIHVSSMKDFLGKTPWAFYTKLLIKILLEILLSFRCRRT